MSSFRKATDSHININGTKTKNNLLFVSSGVVSLDHIVGGGLPLGAIFAVEEDVLGNYSRILNKYFLAEGVVCKHALFIASADDNPHEIVQELPQNCTVSSDDELNAVLNEAEKMKIAWRYEGLSQVESSFGKNTSFGHHFDLSKHIDVDTINNTNIIFWNAENTNEEENTKGFTNSIYYSLLKNIKKAISNEEYQSSGENKNVLRISILSLGSPIWMAKDCDEDSDANSYGQDLLKFMYCLRNMLKDTSAVAFVTIPSHLFDDGSFNKRLLYSVHNAVKIESFAGSSRETNPVYKDYHGLFHVIKLSPLYSLVPFVPPSLDLAFKLRRKKFIIEKLHLPPELQESSEREQDDIIATPKTCGDFKKKDLDF